MRLKDIRKLPALILSILMLAGCATGGVLNKQSIKPESLVENGILFGEFIGGTGAFSDAGGPGSYWLSISGVSYHVDKEGDAFSVSLAPGDYVLEKIRHNTGSVNSTYNIGKKFSIRKGKVTSLGGLFLIEREAPDQDVIYGSTQGTFNVVQVDDRDRALDYLQHVLPDVYAALQDKNIYQAGGTHVSGEKLNILRKAVALGYANSRLSGYNPWRAGGVYLVTAKLGTAGWIKIGDSGRPERYLPFELNSVDSVEECDAKGRRYVCILSRDWGQDEYNAHLVYFDGKKVSNLTVPDGIEIRGVHLFGEHGVAVGDLDFALYTKLSDNSSWRRYEKEGVESGLLISKYGFQDYEGGFFTLYQGAENLLIKVDANTGLVSEMTLPEFGSVDEFVSTENHLLLGPEYKFLSARRMYVYNKRSEAWSQKEIPEECVSPRFEQVTDSTLVVGCHNLNNSVFTSKDWGDSWVEARR